MRNSKIISELKGAKTHLDQPIKNIDDLHDYMVSLGFEFVGGGEFSLVFESPLTDAVVKVYNDECYDEFVKFCFENLTNPFLPKFRGRGVRLRDGARMIRIEKLLPLSINDCRGIQLLTNLVKKGGSGPHEMWDFTPKQQMLYNTVEALYKSLRAPCTMDIHSGNVMQRPNGQIVIIDPFAPDRDGWFTTHRSAEGKGRIPGEKRTSPKA